MARSQANVFYAVNALAVLLCFAVIMVGAYVRLSNAGLGCPDWPGCYGHLDVPAPGAERAAANAAYPTNPVQPAKAWKEMIHRYLASTLGLLILCMAGLAWWRRREPGQQRWLPGLLLLLVVFQGLLGMWTVTLLLKPLIVTGHLLGGMATLALLWLCLLRQGKTMSRLQATVVVRGLAALALAVLFLQLFLGAWTSTNYAGLACPDFPTCLGQWWPRTDFATAFTLWHGLPVNYAGGVLDSAARATIHVSHRLGALVTACVVLLLTATMWRLGNRQRGWRGLAVALVLVTALQVGLGISIVLAHLPLGLAVAHSGGAALLVLAVMAINHAAWGGRT
ncbi:MAG: COX15/CtaA family protein [Salinisphaera sp.]|nr:COX15/CtaA family protein [Salinisphaera sp.]